MYTIVASCHSFSFGPASQQGFPGLSAYVSSKSRLVSDGSVVASEINRNETYSGSEFMLNLYIEFCYRIMIRSLVAPSSSLMKNAAESQNLGNQKDQPSYDNIANVMCLTVLQIFSQFRLR